MTNKLKIFILFLSLMFTFNAPTTGVFAANAQPQASSASSLKATTIVKSPNSYLNKDIKLTAKFVAFTSLGLDYPKAMRPSKEYVGFLIMRDDTAENIIIPLSELKLFMKQSLAEKYVDLEQGDTVELNIRIFSTALGDAWGDISTLSVVKKINKKK